MVEEKRAQLRKILTDYHGIFTPVQQPAPLDMDLKLKRLKEFFTGFRALAPDFFYRPRAYPPAEFRRLMKAVSWPLGVDVEERNKKARRDFNTIYGTIDCWMFYGRTSLPPVTGPSGQGSGEGSGNPSGHPVNKTVTPPQDTSITAIPDANLSKSPLTLFF